MLQLLKKRNCKCKNSHFNKFKSIKNSNIIKFLQHTCIKFINVMLSYLKYVIINKYDIVLLQKP